MTETALLKDIHDIFLSVEELLSKADQLMRQRDSDREINACEKQDGRAGWSRFRAQAHRYTEQYGLDYLREVAKREDVSEKQ